MLLLFISYLFGNIAFINSLNPYYIYWYGGFVFVTVYALTDLMDGSRYSFFWELIRCGLGLWLLYNQQDWFGSSQWWSLVVYLLSAYFVFSAIVTAFIAFNRSKEIKLQTAINTNPSTS